MGVEHGIKLGVMKFSTEDDHDYLTVNGNDYSGGEAEVVGGIESLVATGTIAWSSDFSIEGEGWKICHGVEPAEHTTCDTVFDDLELAEGEEKHVTCPDGCAHDHQASTLDCGYVLNANIGHTGKETVTTVGTETDAWQMCCDECKAKADENPPCAAWVYIYDGYCYLKYDTGIGVTMSYGSSSSDAGMLTASTPASTAQDVWGSNPYTSDSNVCKSAAHFGKDGMPIQVKALGKKSEFEKSTRNGISTKGWSGEWNAVSISGQ